MRIRYGLVALLALLLSVPAMAQESPAIVAAKHHFRTQAVSAFADDDFADLHARDAYLDRRTGATNVYLAQRYAGIEVWGAIAPAAVLPSGKVHALAPSYYTNLATRVNSTEPQFASGAAVSTAEAYVQRFEGVAPEGPIAVTDAPGESDAPAAVTFEATAPRLVYQPIDDGALRLAWEFTLTAERGAMQMWSIRVDAITGTVLAADDLVARDRFASDAPASGASAPISRAPLAELTRIAPEASAARAGSYRVLPWPVESPSHGAFGIVRDPDDATASPSGWHDTGSQTFTTTRGNNVWTYLDRDDDEQPDAGTDVDGGASLSFDFAYDATQNPRENASAALTNLFYWGNIFHDVTYQYGFDEASGNFQVNNFGNGGAGNDAARLEVQSGAQRCNDDPINNPNRFACYNNANFGTPSDGGSGRMQMYEWYNSSETVVVTAPASIRGEYPAAPALFGVPGAVSGTAVAVENASSAPGRGCTVADVTNGAAVSGNVAMIERGDCSFSDKVKTAQALGASAAIIYNNDRKGTGETGNPNDLSLMAISPDDADDITIPAVFLGQSNGQLIVRAAEAVVSIDKDPKRDSDLDAGVILHEFGHGLSNRLTGGPSSSGCLSNQEQMGEGWSDYYGLLLTMPNADATPRGIATYLEFEGTDGSGIRPARYSRSFDVNDLTYQDVISFAYVFNPDLPNGGSPGPRGLTVPHGVGTAWATVLWDMTLDLVDQFGFDQNVYNADGGKGNQIALNLVTQGLKLQGCSPGFVSGRDGILEADTLLYNGAHSDIIWEAFARRGLGIGAAEGSTSNANDGTADFNSPVVSRENGPNTSGARLTVVGPNPVRNETALRLSLAAPEAVTVQVIDLLGRSVQTLHKGPLAAAGHTFEMDAAGLSPGVYIVRAQGDTFSATQRVTIVR